MTRIAMLIVGVSLTMAPASAQQATQEDFRELCSAFAGRWVSDIRLSVDVDGIGNQGDKTPFYSEFQDENNGHLLVGKMFTGTGSATWILVYDQGAKRIRAMFVTSGGGTDTAIVYKQGEDWYQVGDGTLAGDKNTFKNKIEISDGGNTHTWTQTGTLAGKPLPETKNVYKRLKSDIPAGGKSQEFQEFGDAIVGLWECDVTFINDWPDQKKGAGEKVKGYSLYRWINDKRAILRVDYSGNDSGTQILFWDPSTQAIADVAIRSSGMGGKASIRKVGERKWMATLNQAALPDGTPISGGLVYTFSADGKELQFAGQITDNAKPLAPLVDMYRRLY